MGNWIQKIMSSFGQQKNTKILLLGLDGAGKTTLIYKLKLGEFLSTIPTIGFNVEAIKYKKLNMTVWDLGGQKSIRDLWRHYYENTDALIFIIDSCDKERLELAKEELHHLMEADELKRVPVLVFANKQDMGIMTVSEIMSKLDMRKLNTSWQVQGCSAVSGDGVYDGLDWLNNEMEKKH
jgi:small GTP-binding protein